MLVREYTNQIQISKENKIISVVQTQHEYTYKRRVYNFNQILDDEEEHKCESPPSKAKVEMLEHQSARGEGSVRSSRSEKIEKDGPSKSEKDVNLKRQTSQVIVYNGGNKEQSYTLLKILAGILVVLIAMTLFQYYSPNSKYNLLLLFQTPTKIALPSSMSQSQSEL